MSDIEIQHFLAKLPANERGSLAAWLLETLPPHGTEDATAEGIEEAVRRREEIDSGRVHPISPDEFWTAVTLERASWK
jgi:hypothetical protein